MTNWTDYVKSFAKENNTTYGCALSDPACSAGYRKKFGNKKTLGKNKETESMMTEDINRAVKSAPKKTPQRKEQLSALKQKLNKKNTEKQLLETTGMMAEDINQYVPVQDLAGNFVPQEQLENIVMKIKEKGVRGRPKKYSTAEEARKAKIANTIAGAKRRKVKKDEPELASRQEAEDYILDRSSSGTIIASPSQLGNQVVKEIFFRIITENEDNFKTKASKTKIYNKIQKADAEEMASLIKEYFSPNSPKRINFLKKEKFLKDFFTLFKGDLAKKGQGNTFRRELAKQRGGKGVINQIEKLFPIQSAIISGVSNIVRNPKAVIFGRNDYPPKVRQIISKYGNKNITGITLGRSPLGKPLMTALQLASGNTFAQKLQNTPYDKLFHLFICIEFADGSRIMLEKNEVINAMEGCKLPKETETKSTTSSDIPTALTLNDALERVRERMGKNFFTYSAKDNNCQDFIVAFLKSNNIGNETDTSWVKQDTKVLFEGNDRLRKIANTLTDIGARVDVLRQGAGIKKSANSIKGMPNAWITHTKEFAKKNNMKYNDALKDPANKASYKKGGMMDTHKSKVIKKGGKFNLLKSITDVGTKVGEPFKATTGLNPFTFGYDLGHDVIGPALMKGRGMPTSRDAYIAELYEQANLGANGRVKL